MDASIATALESTATGLAASVGTVTSWWFFPIVVGLFVAGLLISLVAGFFGKRGRKRGKR